MSEPTIFLIPPYRGGWQCFEAALRNAGIYDVPLWRLLQRMADIRNLCAHSKDRDPRDDEINDLLAGTEKIVKEIT